ncbi:MAG: nicotinate (nicotinamide) nucleotide adenylyltransferase [Anaerovoracaceae bacterium]|jgi:nicotinate-nucleotide adenylyltransferase
MNVGILGGTFDPFHNGHRTIIDAAIRDLELDEVLLMPAHVSPFKIGHEMAPSQDRVNMLMSVADEMDRVKVSTYEIDSEKISYTYNTLTALREKYPKGWRFWFLLGTDQFLQLEQWYHGKDLMREFRIALAPRPGYREKEYLDMLARYRREYHTVIRVLENVRFDVSSTEIKERIREGKSISGLVPASVERYINEHGLYR